MINLREFVNHIVEQHPPKLSFLQSGMTDLQKWRTSARMMALNHLRYTPSSLGLDPEILESIEVDGLVREKLSFKSATDVNVPAYLIRPAHQTGRLPGIVALHDHGSYYIHGKEKLVALEDEPPHLLAYKRSGYGGRSYATELARQGYVVLVTDAFYFGERRLDLKDVFPSYAQNVFATQPARGSAVNRANEEHTVYEEVVARYLFASGTTWMGIMAHDDRKSVDYLVSRPEVDPEKIGCIGLSMGGMRSNWLFGTDPRIKAAVTVGWMTNWRYLMERHVSLHSWSQFVPGLLEWLELSDLVSIGMPGALFVQQCTADNLFPLYGMTETCREIEAAYTKADLKDRFWYRFYDVPHEFNTRMQDDAFAWLDQWLKDH